MKTKNTTLYSINIQDVQTVAKEKLGRELAQSEIKMVEDKIGDHLDWYAAIECALDESIG